VRRHESAAIAPSNRNRASQPANFARGAFAIPASSRRADGSGAPAHRSLVVGNRLPRFLIVPLCSVVALLALAAGAPMASATQYQRPVVEEFGSVETPTFEGAGTVVVDHANGDILVASEPAFSGTIERFHADGTPAPFTALGSNEINGKAGPGEKPCAEEPASCDQTPQNGIETYSLGTYYSQVAIDESGGPTDGDILITEYVRGAVTIFSPGGKYLGQLTARNFAPLEEPCGVAVGGSGVIYVSENAGHGISEFVPSGNPPVNSDYVKRYPEPSFSVERPCNLQLGTGATAGSLFFSYRHEPLPGESNLVTFGTGSLELDDGEYTNVTPSYGLLLGVNPTTGNLLLRQTAYNDALAGAFPGQELAEFSGADATSPLSRLITEKLIDGFAVGGAGQVYVTVGEGLEPRPLLVYGPPQVTPTVEVNPAANVTGKAAFLSGVVDPSGLEVEECFFEYGPASSFGHVESNHTVPCAGAIPTDSAEHVVHASISGLVPNGANYKARLVARNENGTERSTSRAFSTAYLLATEAATGVGVEKATLRGTVLPEGLEFQECFFEWGRADVPGFEHKSTCSPPGPAIDPSLTSQVVSLALTGLQRNTEYRFRLIAANAEGTLVGEELIFTTLGLPQLNEVRASFATRNSVTLEAKVNPSGAPTSYRFEWGTGTGYGNKVPLNYEPFVGSGTEPVQVKAELSGLAPATRYHYRVVATNSQGTERSADQVAETLNTCEVASAGIEGLPDGRCFELVSPAEAGPVARPGRQQGTFEMGGQVAPSGPGAVAYDVESGFPDATAGAESLYLSRRTSDSWPYPTQLKPPITALGQRADASINGYVLGLNDPLSCEVVISYMPLTNDPGAEENRELGGGNLYRRATSGGPWTAITKLPPETGAAEVYSLAGMSQDCETVVFSTASAYPGVAGETNSSGKRLYEWRDGAFFNLGLVPGEGGEQAISPASEPGGPRNAVSEDGSRVFFDATRRSSPNPAEVGSQGVFVRKAGGEVVDISLSQTGTPDTGATFQWATPDGTRAFFTANAGLASAGSSAGTDLYEYDLTTGELTDLSVAASGEVAEVDGFVGGANDGSRVYFMAQGQLVPGRGRTAAANASGSTANLYSEAGGTVSFVATVGTGEDVQIIGGSESQSSVTEDGLYLAFSTQQKVTGYDSHGSEEAYLYNSALGSKGTVCMSCRQDGLPPTNSHVFMAFSQGIAPARSIGERNGEAAAFFTSRESLASGAPEGEGSLYEWAHGQVFKIAGEPAITTPLGFSQITLKGVDADGTNVYLATAQTLTWEDGDQRSSIYDARIGGGFPDPGKGSSTCQPTSEGEGSCLSAPAAVPTPAGAASATFTGPGNPKAAQQKQKKKKKSKKKKSKKGKKKKQAAKKQRHGKQGAKGNRKAGK
jgi:hypothetical protein